MPEVWSVRYACGCVHPHNGPAHAGMVCKEHGAAITEAGFREEPGRWRADLTEDGRRFFTDGARIVFPDTRDGALRIAQLLNEGAGR